jgi:hypothetical protein
VRAVDEQPAEITVPSFANSPEARFAASRVLPRNQPEPSRKLSATAEYIRLCYRCSDCRRDDRSNPWNGSQTLADGVVLVPRNKLDFELGYGGMNIFDLVDDYLQYLTSHIRDTLVRLIHDNANQSHHFVQTLRLDQAELSQVPRRAFTSVVRWRISSSLARASLVPIVAQPFLPVQSASMDV